MIVDRREMREKLSSLLSMLTNVEAPLRPSADEIIASAEGPVSDENIDNQESAVDADATRDGPETSQTPDNSSQDDNAQEMDQTLSGDQGSDSKSGKSG